MESKSSPSFVQTPIVEHHPIARDTWKLTIESRELASRTLPGQFFMVRIADNDDPLIGRALALYDMQRDATGVPKTISVVYTVKGKFTSALARLRPGSLVEFWGPLGNGFAIPATDHLILVAGGVGQTPMLTLASAALGIETYGSSGVPTLSSSRGTSLRGVKPSSIAKRVTLCYGARTKDYLAGIEDFQRVCTEVRIATDDGSLGHHGRVTEILEQTLDASPASESARIACCGPEPMMQAVSKIAIARNVPCQVSLETPMACGIGICFTCVAKIKQPDGSWDYKRTCVEGPVFKAEKIVWE